MIDIDRKKHRVRSLRIDSGNGFLEPVRQQRSRSCSGQVIMGCEMLEFRVELRLLLLDLAPHDAVRCFFDRSLDRADQPP